MRGDIEKATYLNFPMWRISNATRNSQLLNNSFPMLAYEALLRKQLVDFGNILTELRYLFDQDVGKTGKNNLFKECIQI